MTCKTGAARVPKMRTRIGFTDECRLTLLNDDFDKSPFSDFDGVSAVFRRQA